MTVLAFLAVSALVNIIEFMAAVTVTVLLRFGLLTLSKVVSRVALVTGDPLVITRELVFGIPVVIKLYLVPLLRAMAVLAFRTKAILVNILDGMTGRAVFGGILELILDVAQVAGHFLVSASKFEIGLVMVELL